MIIRTVKQNGEFAILPKAALNNADLSWEARGLLSYLLEKPDGWEISLTNLVRNGPAQEHKVRRVLGELKDAGYVARIRVNGDGGTFHWITQIYETPQPVVQPYGENHYMVDQPSQPSRDNPRVDNPRVDNPHVDYPRVENREIYQYPLQQEPSEAIPNQKQEQQQQHASAAPDTVSGDAAAAVLLSPEQKTALGLMAWNVPSFTAPESFVLRYDPKLIGHWCIAIDAMSGEELEAIKSLPAFLYSMVKRGEWPALPGRLADRWEIAMGKIAGDAQAELDY